MIFIRSSAPHVHSLKSTSFIMGCTAFALMPAAAALTFAYGFGVIWHIIIAVVAAEVFEAICVLMRGRSVGTALGDLSAMLTAVIFAVAVPPYLPWYLVVGGMFFGIVVVKPPRLVPRADDRVDRAVTGELREAGVLREP